MMKEAPIRYAMVVARGGRLEVDLNPGDLSVRIKAESPLTGEWIRKTTSHNGLDVAFRSLKGLAVSAMTNGLGMSSENAEQNAEQLVRQMTTEVKQQWSFLKRPDLRAKNDEPPYTDEIDKYNLNAATQSRALNRQYLGVIQRNVPQFLGGLRHHSVEEFEDMKNMQHVWTVMYGDGKGETIAVEVKASSWDITRLRGPTSVGQFLQDRIREAIEKARKKHPGDFEVECKDSTGIGHLFDEGMTYLAEQHEDDGLMWVYDMNGEKGEYATFRFWRAS